MIKFSIKEKREKFLFFLSVFLVTSTILCVAIFYNYGGEATVSKAEFSRRIIEEEQFEDLVTEALPTADTTYSKIVKFNPNVQALFLENDIKESIGALKSYYNRRPYDRRYRIFIQASKIFENLYYDKRELTGNDKDISTMSKQLEDCKLSTRQYQQSLGASR